MSRRILSLLLVICFVFSTSVNAFAKETTAINMQEDEGVCVFYVGDNKLILWESDNSVYVEQHDLQGNLIVSGIADRISGEIVMSDNNIFNASDIVETISSNLSPSLYTFVKVGTFPIYNRITLDRKTMYLYEQTGSAVHTTYSIRSYSGTIAALAAGIATGMAVPTAIASNLVSCIISAGLGVLVSDTLNIGTKITLAADKYQLDYYGKDSITGKKSSTYSQTDKYIITDELSNKINKVYYEGSCYYNPSNDTPTSKLLQYIVPNLYGTDYEWER